VFVILINFIVVVVSAAGSVIVRSRGTHSGFSRHFVDGFLNASGSVIVGARRAASGDDFGYTFCAVIVGPRRTSSNDYLSLLLLASVTCYFEPRRTFQFQACMSVVEGSRRAVSNDGLA